MPTSNPMDSSDNRPSDAKPTMQATAIVVPPDVASIDSLHRDFRPMPRKLLLHPDVQDHLDPSAVPTKRLSIVLQHLAAHGRTSRVKGCGDAQNRGWRRSPLGGNGPYHYYLWWAPAGTPQTRKLHLPDGAIVVRDVRHHDDHSPLHAGNRSEYLELSQREILGNGIGEEPWTDEQRAYVQSSDAIRVVLGRPGSGKTTVLWNAVEARSHERVLYLTWSGRLRAMTEERIAAFGSPTSTIQTLTFHEFLGELSGHDIPLRPYRDILDAFLQAIHRLPDSELGPWKSRRETLFAELRAFLIGHATVPDGLEPVPRLSDEAYRALRGETIGGECVRALLRIYRLLKQRGRLGTLFPEFVAVKAAHERLAAGTLPDRYERFDRVVLDEVQDLTPCEMSVILAFCHCMASRTGRAPWILMAGDSGQTVRPTGFDWGTLNGSISATLGRPTRYDLRQSLRCPEPIARVVARADALYKELTKDLHPDKQLQYIEALPGEDVQLGAEEIGNYALVYVTLADVSEAVELLESLEQMDAQQTAVVTPSPVLPSWLGVEHRDQVLTPAIAKGLEFETVIILEPGKVVQQVRGRQTDNPYECLADLERRLVIDGLRVAASRATQVLVFVDIAPDDETLRMSQELLGDYQPMDLGELLAFLGEEEAPLYQRIRDRLDEAERLFDELPRRAWHRAYQALVLARGGGGATAQAEPQQALDAARMVLRFAASWLASGVPRGISRDMIIDGASEALDNASLAPERRLFDAFLAWTSHPHTAAYAFLDTVCEYCDGQRKKPEWLDAGLRLRQQALRKFLMDGPRSVEHAPKYVGNVEGWLSALGYSADRGKLADNLRSIAFETLLENGRLESAEELLSSVWPRDRLRRARLREKQGRHEAAARLYERVGRQQDALRNWRRAAAWDEAYRLATDADEQADLAWLREVQKLMGRRPPGIRRRLSPAEAMKLAQLVKDCTQASSQTEED